MAMLQSLVERTTMQNSVFETVAEKYLPNDAHKFVN